MYLLVEWTEEDNFSVVSASRVKESEGKDPLAFTAGEHITVEIGTGRQAKNYSATVLMSGVHKNKLEAELSRLLQDSESDSDLSVAGVDAVGSPLGASSKPTTVSKSVPPAKKRPASASGGTTGHTPKKVRKRGGAGKSKLGNTAQAKKKPKEKTLNAAQAAKKDAALAKKGNSLAKETAARSQNSSILKQSIESPEYDFPSPNDERTASDISHSPSSILPTTSSTLAPHYNFQTSSAFPHSIPGTLPPFYSGHGGSVSTHRAPSLSSYSGSGASYHPYPLPHRHYAGNEVSPPLYNPTRSLTPSSDTEDLLRQEIANLKSEVEKVKADLKYLKREKKKEKEKRREIYREEEPVAISTSATSVGCIFGDPKGYNVVVEGVAKEGLLGVDCAEDPNKLATSLLDLLFSKDDLSTGNATSPRRSDIRKLDMKRLNAIRAHVFFRFPLEEGMFSVDEARRWKKIKTSVLNVRCRFFRSRKELSF